jgi:quercetin dioxygenase-like cupin family protein
MKPRHVRHAELQLINGPVTADGGELLQLSGSEHGLVTSVMYAHVAPGSGPRRHRHPHAEIFVIHDGQGRYEVEGQYVDAVAGDMVIVPPNAWHSFRNTGVAMLRQTAIHETPELRTDFEDGTRRG